MFGSCVLLGGDCRFVSVRLVDDLVVSLYNRCEDSKNRILHQIVPSVGAGLVLFLSLPLFVFQQWLSVVFEGTSFGVGWLGINVGVVAHGVDVGQGFGL